MRLSYDSTWLRGVVTAALLLGCGGEDNDDSQKKEGDTSDCGNYFSCGDLLYESIGWEETSELGVTAAEVFEPIEGSCTSTLDWDARPMGEGILSPEKGTSDVTVQLAFDRDTVEIGRYPGVDAGSDSYCSDIYLRAQAVATVTSADGVFDDSGAVTVSYIASDGLVAIQLDKDFDDLGGASAVTLKEGENGSLSYRFDGASKDCAGSILMRVSYAEKDGTASESTGEIGGWTNTGCPLGEEWVSLDEPKGDGRSILEVFSEVWSGLSIAGQWDDGSKTDLNIDAAVSVLESCKEAISIEFPVSVTFGTSDEKLKERTVEGIASATISDDGSVWSTSINVSEDRTCVDADSDLGYGFGDCDTLTGITIQFRISRTADDTWSISDDGVMIYEYDIDSTASPESADRVRELTLLF